MLRDPPVAEALPHVDSPEFADVEVEPTEEEEVVVEAGPPSFHEELDLMRARLALPPAAADPPSAAGLSGRSASGAGIVLFGAELEDWKVVMALLAHRGLIPTDPLEVAVQQASFHRRW